MNRNERKKELQDHFSEAVLSFFYVDAIHSGQNCDERLRINYEKICKLLYFVENHWIFQNFCCLNVFLSKCIPSFLGCCFFVNFFFVHSHFNRAWVLKFKTNDGKHTVNLFTFEMENVWKEMKKVWSDARINPISSPGILHIQRFVEALYKKKVNETMR